MEQIKNDNVRAISPSVEFIPAEDTSDIHFMTANIHPVEHSELSERHMIPVFAKDYKSTISHQEFIETISFVTDQIFGGETILKPAALVSRPIKGRVPVELESPL